MALDLNTLSVDELSTRHRELGNQIAALKEDQRKTSDVYTKKIAGVAVAKKVARFKSSLSPSEAAILEADKAK